MRDLVAEAKVSVLIDAGQLAERVAELGQEISRDHERKDLLVVCVLKGSVLFFADLCRSISVPLRMDMLAVESYHGGTQSSGNVRFVHDLREDVSGRHVLLVEDIVDTGRTITHLVNILGKRGPASVKVATLLDKPSRRVEEVDLAYTGFEVPDRFVIGYGLDYAQYFRNLPYIGVLEGPAELLNA